MKEKSAEKMFLNLKGFPREKMKAWKSLNGVIELRYGLDNSISLVIDC